MGLRGKLIIALLALALLPLFIIEVINLRNLRYNLEAEAQRALDSAAAGTASAIDGFFRAGLDAVRTEAQLPTLIAYMENEPRWRDSPDGQAEILALLRALTLRDRVHISSYALLDLEGMTLLDTWGADIGRDRSEWSFFRVPIESQRPFVSPVLFDDDKADPSASGEVGVYFSSPIRDSSGSVVGVLACRYRATILPALIGDQKGLAGAGSYPVLEDENGLILAHGGSPTLAWKLRSSRTIEQLSTLARQRRVSWQQTQSTTRSSAPAIAEPTDQSRYSVARHTLQTQPWQVLFVAPVDRIRAPAEAQAKKSLTAGLALAVITIVIGVLLAGFLTRSLRRMTDTAKTIASGKYCARVEVESSDEIGELAQAFNTMATRVGELVGNLEERVIDRTAELRESNAKLSRGLELAEEQKREIAGLNDELRRQIAERSRTLGEALERLATHPGGPQPVNEGEIIDDLYEVGASLGSGAMGQVFAVRRLSDDRRLALKVLTGNHNTRALARFAREAQLASTVSSPYVVQVVDVGFSNSGFMYLVMERVAGHSLREARERYGDVSWALPIIAQVAAGLAAIHEKDVIHRDLKPSNVITAQPREGSIRVKIVDFGVSAVIDQLAIDAAETAPITGAREAKKATEPNQAPVELPMELVDAETITTDRAQRLWTSKPSASMSGRNSLTGTGGIVGTPTYMAPELAYGAEQASPASDIFSLGVMAYELLSAERPFSVPAFIATKAMKAVPIPETLSAYCPDLPTEVSAIISQALAIDPAARPDAKTVARVIDAAAGKR